MPHTEHIGSFLNIANLPPIDKQELDKACEEEIKEFHFHIYFNQNNDFPNSGWQDYAEKLYHKIQQLITAEFFQCRLGKFFDKPAGPHPMPMFEVWCPKESFSRLYSWFVVNRGDLSILIHPLSKEEFLDHTDRAVFMGQAVKLDPAIIRKKLEKEPLEHPELGLGYSAP